MGRLFTKAGVFPKTDSRTTKSPTITTMFRIRRMGWGKQAFTAHKITGEHDTNENG
jgi:hypothetical protein